MLRSIFLRISKIRTHILDPDFGTRSPRKSEVLPKAEFGNPEFGKNSIKSGVLPKKPDPEPGYGKSLGPRKFGVLPKKRFRIPEPGINAGPGKSGVLSKKGRIRNTDTGKVRVRESLGSYRKRPNTDLGPGSGTTPAPESSKVPKKAGSESGLRP